MAPSRADIAPPKRVCAAAAVRSGTPGRGWLWVIRRRDTPASTAMMPTSSPEVWPRSAGVGSHASWSNVVTPATRETVSDAEAGRRQGVAGLLPRLDFVAGEAQGVPAQLCPARRYQRRGRLERGGEKLIFHDRAGGPAVRHRTRSGDREFPAAQRTRTDEPEAGHMIEVKVAERQDHCLDAVEKGRVDMQCA